MISQMFALRSLKYLSLQQTCDCVTLTSRGRNIQRNIGSRTPIFPLSKRAQPVIYAHSVKTQQGPHGVVSGQVQWKYIYIYIYIAYVLLSKVSMKSVCAVSRK
ncbi:Hypothetical_protein [Hexamita inflata]|uniref:Hypothetical_protein n=1 Tax=Hexamita inflata TaxID=28002 RepID=A0AA86TZX5_9EUKA|nr:Hypothetical protein HINF_LOCUS20912 [Hexamita inflata]